MTTKRETILAAVRTALTGTTGVSSRIYRSRVEPISRGESPAIVVEPVSDSAQQNTSLPTLDWSMTVRVAIIVRGAIPRPGGGSDHRKRAREDHGRPDPWWLCHRRAADQREL